MYEDFMNKHLFWLALEGANIHLCCIRECIFRNADSAPDTTEDAFVLYVICFIISQASVVKNTLGQTNKMTYGQNYRIRWVPKEAKIL